MTNPRAVDPNTAENLAFVCVGLSLLADVYERQANTAEGVNDDHTMAYCRRVSQFLVLELRPKYGESDEHGDKLKQKIEKRIEDEKKAAEDPNQTKLPLDGGGKEQQHGSADD